MTRMLAMAKIAEEDLGVDGRFSNALSRLGIEGTTLRCTPD